MLVNHVTLIILLWSSLPAHGQWQQRSDWAGIFKAAGA